MSNMKFKGFLVSAYNLRYGTKPKLKKFELFKERLSLSMTTMKVLLK